MSTQNAIALASLNDVSDRPVRASILWQVISLAGWTIGLAILSPLFPIIGLMHLLAWLCRQTGG